VNESFSFIILYGNKFIFQLSNNFGILNNKFLFQLRADFGVEVNGDVDLRHLVQRYCPGKNHKI
jgi:hypothetical protein